MECVALEPQLHDARAKYELLTDLCQGDEEGALLGQGEDEGALWAGEDEARLEQEEAERRHRHLLDKLSKQKEALSDELSKYSKMSSFLWLV